jgi:hypothetical protein
MLVSLTLALVCAHTDFAAAAAAACLMKVRRSIFRIFTP